MCESIDEKNFFASSQQICLLSNLIKSRLGMIQSYPRLIQIIIINATRWPEVTS